MTFKRIGCSNAEAPDSIGPFVQGRHHTLLAK